MTQKLNKELSQKLKELGVSFEDLHPFFLHHKNHSLQIKNQCLGVFNSVEKCFVCVDFQSKKLRFRSQSHLFAELIIKAVMGRAKKPLKVLDATTGFGKDSYLLALAGNQVHAYESNPIMHVLLKDGVQRITDTEIANRIYLQNKNSKHDLGNTDCDVIYLDPMYPESKKSAKNSKEMSFLQDFVGHQTQQAEELLTQALQSKTKKIVLKRPLKASFCLNKKPTSQIKGKAVRFDVYAINNFSS